MFKMPEANVQSSAVKLQDLESFYTHKSNLIVAADRSVWLNTWAPVTSFALDDHVRIQKLSRGYFIYRSSLGKLLWERRGNDPRLLEADPIYVPIAGEV